MFCTKCSKQIPDDSQFCKYCGTEVKGADETPTKKASSAKEPERPEEESDEVDFQEAAETVKRALGALSSKVGSAAKAKAKKVMDEAKVKAEVSERETSDEPGEKEGSEEKPSSGDKTELAGIIVSGICIVLFFIFAITVVSQPKESTETSDEPIAAATSEEPAATEDDPDAPRHAVHLFVDFDSNWFFDRYDVQVSVDGQALGTLPHGEDGSYDLDITDREHTFSVVDTEGKGRIGTTTFDATDLSVVGFNIDIGDDRIYVEPIDTVSVPFAPDEAVGKTRQEVEDAFRDAGFGNITVNELDDLPLDQIGSADTVESVTVMGSDSFAEGDAFFPDNEVVIAVHTPSKVKAPVSSASLLGQNYEEAAAQLEAAGFTVECNPTSFYDSDYGDWEVKEVAVDVLFASDEFEAGDEFDYGTAIKLYYNEPQEEEEPSEWDRWWDARGDFESYGEALYPYGFECHWIMNLIAKEDQGDGTYFIKVGVTITNEYGVEREAIAQGIAGNGTVRDFWVN
jgi:hypothetical protein